MKLEVLNLGAKLFVTKAQKSEALFNHVLNMARYDMNYDVRDRARFLKALCQSTDQAPTLAQNAARILFALKPTPKFDTVSAGKERFTAGSLSHLLNKAAEGYQELPDFPETAPDSSTRNVQEERWQPQSSDTLFVRGADGGRDRKRSKKDRKFDNLESFLNSGDEEEESEDDDSYSDRSEYSSLFHNLMKLGLTSC